MDPHLLSKALRSTLLELGTRALVSLRNMPRHRRSAEATQSELDRVAKAAKRGGVPVTVEKIKPDGTRTIITAGVTGDVKEMNGGTDENIFDIEAERLRKKNKGAT